MILLMVFVCLFSMPVVLWVCIVFYELTLHLIVILTSGSTEFMKIIMCMQGVPGVQSVLRDLIPEMMVSQKRHGSNLRRFRSHEFLKYSK